MAEPSIQAEGTGIIEVEITQETPIVNLHPTDPLEVDVSTSTPQVDIAPSENPVNVQRVTRDLYIAEEEDLKESIKEISESEITDKVEERVIDRFATKQQYNALVGRVTANETDISDIKNNGVNKIGTTAEWNVKTTYIPPKGQIIIYSDYKVVNGVSVAGIKVGNGTSYVQNLPFTDAYLENKVTGMHHEITASELKAELDKIDKE